MPVSIQWQDIFRYLTPILKITTFQGRFPAFLHRSDAVILESLSDVIVVGCQINSPDQLGGVMEEANV